MAAVSYGGQAVLEGVMMRSPSSWAVAIRTPEGEITEVVQDVSSPMQRRKVWRLPVIRGVVALGESLAIGFRALAISANVASQERDENGEIQTQIGRGQIIFSFAIAIGFAIALFKVGPALLTSWLPVESTELFVIVEGLIRVGVFIAYILLISLLPDLRRVFQYHGAEHKVVFNYEKKLPLTVENARAQSRLHPRCGTSFLLFVLLVSIVLFALIPKSAPFLVKFGGRLLLVPFIAGLSYEVLRFTAKKADSPVFAFLVAPGLMLQKITTQEPTDDMLAVAIAALEEALREDGLMPETELAEAITDTEEAPALA
jgi:uncharacterized protein YqhQ